jgi:hypothetical protein
MHVEVIETEAALQALAPTWERLWTSIPQTDIFASFDWFCNWWEHFGTGTSTDVMVVRDGDGWHDLRGDHKQLHVLVVWEHDAVVAIAPLLLVRTRWRRWPVRLLMPPLNAHAPRSGLLVSPTAPTAVTALVEYLATSTRWDMLWLDGIPGLSRVVSTCGAVAARRLRLGRQQPSWSHAYLALESTWEQYLARQKRHFRKHLWQAERALARLGTVTMDCYTCPEAIPDAMQRFIEIDGASWKAREGESLASHPAIAAYYTALATRLAQRQRCEIWLLSIAHEPAAAFLCLRDGRVLYTLKTSYKEKFASAQHAPSIVLLAHMIQVSWQQQRQGIDFVGRMPFVERWTAAGQAFEPLIAWRRHPYADLVRLADWTRRYAGKAQRFLRRYRRSQ